MSNVSVAHAPRVRSSMTSLGIDVGGSSVKIAAINGSQTLWTTQSSTYARPTRDQLIAAIREGIKGRESDVDSVGICVPGILDRERRMITLSVNIPSIQGIALDELVSEAIGREVEVEIHNDSTASAYDLYVTHNLKGRLLSLTLGTGVGATVLDDGNPIRLSGESPGHIGMVDCSLDDNAPVGPDGGIGSLEAYIGSPALVANYGPDMPATLQRLTENDPPIRALARAIRIFHAIYRPHYVYLIGGLGIHMGHLLPALRKVIDTGLTSVARKDYCLAVGDDHYHAAKGAAKFAVRALLNS